MITRATVGTIRYKLKSDNGHIYYVFYALPTDAAELNNIEQEFIHDHRLLIADSYEQPLWDPAAENVGLLAHDEQRKSAVGPGAAGTRKLH